MVTDHVTNAETRKLGELTGLDTLVVHAVNYELIDIQCHEKLEIPPEEYDCKIKTQKIWRFTILIRGACSLIR